MNNWTPAMNNNGRMKANNSRREEFVGLWAVVFVLSIKFLLE
jgi:hypothetical protein